MSSGFQAEKLGSLDEIWGKNLEMIHDHVESDRVPVMLPLSNGYAPHHSAGHIRGEGF